MAGYIGSKSSVISSGAAFKNTFAISTTTTSLTGVTYTVNRVNVFHNGVRLVDGTDYTATNGTSITLTSAAENGDQIVVTSQASFNIADTYTQAEANSTFLTPTGNGSQLTNLPASGAASLNELTDCTVSTADPAINSNPTSGVGHMWINKTSGEQYILTNATAGSNVWTNVGDGTNASVFAATGGTVTTDGDYKVHTFTSSGTFAVSTISSGDGEVDYLIIAGGGGAGISNSGGGGAGGRLYLENYTGFSHSTSYAITVGAGGAARTDSAGNGHGASGSNSSIASITALGGGGGGYTGNTGLNGGSGGGGQGSSAGGSGTSGQGNDGGSDADGGGGGGAGSAGSGDAAGSGAATSITGTSVTLAGGGAGRNSSAGTSGGGGGPNTSGTANTGGGGGGWTGSGSQGGSGGSGIVIIRYKFQ